MVDRALEDLEFAGAAGSLGAGVGYPRVGSQSGVEYRLLFAHVEGGVLAFDLDSMCVSHRFLSK